jgi:hypothetical protein
MDKKLSAGKLKNNFSPNTRIRIARTTDPHLDGRHGSIVGVSYNDPHCDFYIVQLDDPLPSGWTALQMIESCLDAIGNGGPA